MVRACKRKHGLRNAEAFSRIGGMQETENTVSDMISNFQLAELTEIYIEGRGQHPRVELARSPEVHEGFVPVWPGNLCASLSAIYAVNGGRRRDKR